MKKTYKLGLLSFALLATQAVYGQNETAPLNLGKTGDFLNELGKGVSANARTAASPITLKLDATTSVDAKVNYSKVEGSTKSSYMGAINGNKSGSFFLEMKNGKLSGNVILDKEKKAYAYSSDNAGNATIQEVDINEVVCIDMEHVPANAPVNEVSNAPAENADVPVGAEIGQAVLNLQSLGGAAGCVLLDFDGHYMAAGNYWNNGNPINAASSGMSDDAIREHWEVVSEDFRPFNVNITTSEAVFNSYPRNRRMRCVVTPTNTAAPGAGGVAYISSFNWDNDVPCWVFITSGKSGGEASSHEIGHTFSLGHDGRNNPAEGYFAGHGEWSPIMGVGYYKSVTQWSKGEYNSANNLEDDLSKIAGSQFGVGYRSDDYGNNTGSAANLNIASDGGVSSNNNKGIIERTSDQDYFTFQTAGGNIVLNVNTVARHGDLDILVRLFNSSGAQIGSFNPGGLNATVNANLGAGRYYISVDGTGAGNPATDGYSEYASLGSYFISGNVPPMVATNANAKATFYKDCSFGGYSVGLEEGSYTMNDLIAKGINNDDISSLKVDFGYKVIAYLDNNYTGGSRTFTGDDDCLVNEGYNDLITSLKVIANGVSNLAGTYHVQNRNSGLYLDVWGASTADGANIAQGALNGGTNQQFELVHLRDGIYRIMAKHSGKAMDISGISKADGANVFQYTYLGSDNQKFIVVDAGNGFYKLVAMHSSKVVEVVSSSTANGANVQQWSNHTGNTAQWKLVSVTVTPPAFTSLIQAENYSAMAGVQTEGTTDAGGGSNVGYIDNGDWMAYNNVTFPTTGAYKVEYRVASIGGGALSLDLNAGTIQLGTLSVPNTGGWQNWTTISHNVNVNAGTYNLGLFAQAGGWNINWIRITRVANAAATVEAIEASADVYVDNAASSGVATLVLYPNPTQREVALQTNYQLEGAQYKIFDMTGNVVMQSNNITTSIDVQSLDNGIYTLMITLKDNTQVVERFAKQ